MNNRGYSDRMIIAATDRARAIPRHVALRRVNRKQTDRRPVFALTYDPRLPSIQSMQAKHCEVFAQPPLTAYRRQRNIRDHLIRAKVPSDPKLHPERRQRGMKKCGRNCTAWSNRSE